MVTIDISIPALISLYALLIIPFCIMWYFKVALIKDMLISGLRMSVQLLLVGVYLKYVFEWNSLYINALCVIVMILVANATVVQKAGLNIRHFFWPSLWGITASSLSIVAYLLVVLIQPEPLYEARYLIPITGMLLGNCLRGNILVLERFFNSIATKGNEYLTYLTLGADTKEAIRPYVREALQASVRPTLATMSTIGIVSLPGMMTGQILGGVFPVIAIKYQIAIMLAIFISLMISSTVSIYLSIPYAFNAYGLLNEKILKKHASMRKGE